MGKKFISEKFYQMKNLFRTVRAKSVSGNTGMCSKNGADIEIGVKNNPQLRVYDCRWSHLFRVKPCLGQNVVLM